MKNYIFLKLCLIVSLFAGHALYAQPVVSTTIDPKPLAYFVPGHRIALEAAISDATGIVEARCYFRMTPNGPLLYVPMEIHEGDLYRCTLPSFGEDTPGIEYFFLVVNSQRQVIRSTYRQAKGSPAAALPEWQQGIATDTPLTLFSELNHTGIDGTGIVDPRAALTSPATSEKHGLIVDIYKFEEIPSELNVAHGFFGGFVYEKPGQAPRPVKGFAIGLGTSGKIESEQDTPQSQSRADAQSALTDGAPDIAGSNWSGYFETTGENNRRSITAVITQTDVPGKSYDRVEIVTSKSGLAHHFKGKIQESGSMLLYDQYDNEDWTTHYGPATSTKVAIYDYICPTCSQLNVVYLTRGGGGGPTVPKVVGPKKLRYMSPIYDLLLNGEPPSQSGGAGNPASGR